MNQLDQKVLKGSYPNIPSNYSQELNSMIKSLLQVSPSVRPSCDTILKMDVIKKRLHLAQGNY
jgi:NIMA (never in mitosis gene a)-related kinase